MTRSNFIDECLKGAQGTVRYSWMTETATEPVTKNPPLKVITSQISNANNPEMALKGKVCNYTLPLWASKKSHIWMYMAALVYSFILTHQ